MQDVKAVSVRLNTHCLAILLLEQQESMAI